MADYGLSKSEIMFSIFATFFFLKIINFINSFAFWKHDKVQNTPTNFQIGLLKEIQNIIWYFYLENADKFIKRSIPSLDKNTTKILIFCWHFSSINIEYKYNCLKIFLEWNFDPLWILHFSFFVENYENKIKYSLIFH